MRQSLSPVNNYYKPPLHTSRALPLLLPLGLDSDWFTEWPAEALKGVAMAMMTETDLELGGALEGIVEMFRYGGGSIAYLGLHQFCRVSGFR